MEDPTEMTLIVGLRVERAELVRRVAELEAQLAGALEVAAVERRARLLAEESRRHAWQKLEAWR